MLPKIRQWQESLSERLTIAVISTGNAEQNASLEEHGLEDVLLQEEMGGGRRVARQGHAVGRGRVP